MSLTEFFLFQRREQLAIENDNRLLMDRLAIAMNSKNIDNELKTKPFTSYFELQRKKELKKIQIDNKRMLDRIQHTIPSYRHVEWELDAEKRVEYLRNMTEFPDLFVPPGSSMRKSRIPSANGGTYEEIQNFNLFKNKHDEDEAAPHPPDPTPMDQQQYIPNSQRIERPFLPPIRK
jgi:hypothetical protein